MNSHPVISIDPSTSHGSQLPPFGREVLERVTQGRLLNVFVFAGKDAWEKVYARRERHGAGSAMLLPPGKAPSDFQWPRVDAGVVVLAPERVLAFNLARAIVCTGTPLAFAIYDDGAGSLIVRSTKWQRCAA